MTYFSVMRPHDLLVPTPSGLCCPPGGFHIDPLRPVAKALITHGHSDHARPGHGTVLATQETLDLMRLRYGDDFAGSTQAVRYGETLGLDGVSVSFHPAGHVLGSAQILVARDGLRIVASGGFTPEKIRDFERMEVPVDAYGVGSSLLRGENDFTADVVVRDGQPAAKAGRGYLPNPRLESVS